MISHLTPRARARASTDDARANFGARSVEGRTLIRLNVHCARAVSTVVHIFTRHTDTRHISRSLPVLLSPYATGMCACAERWVSWLPLIKIACLPGPTSSPTGGPPRPVPTVTSQVWNCEEAVHNHITAASQVAAVQNRRPALPTAAALQAAARGTTAMTNQSKREGVLHRPRSCP